MTTPDIKPTRENWHEFCEEPDTTPEEHAEWREMARAIREDRSGKLLDAVMAATVEHRNAPKPHYTRDWSDMVASGDARRRMMRAELAWWREYKRQKQDLEGLPLFDSIDLTT